MSNRVISITAQGQALYEKKKIPLHLKNALCSLVLYFAEKENWTASNYCQNREANRCRSSLVLNHQGKI
jgi:hypothetical protein